MKRNMITEQTPRSMGAELRRLRRAHGWSLAQVCQRLHALLRVELSTKALGAYEQGTRTCGPTRVVELCYVLETRTAEFWAAVDKTLFGTAAPDSITIDLHRVALIARADLAPARTWARTVLKAGGTTTPHIELTAPAISHLAAVCQLDADEVATALCDA